EDGDLSDERRRQPTPRLHRDVVDEVIVDAPGADQGEVVYAECPSMRHPDESESGDFDVVVVQIGKLADWDVADAERKILRLPLRLEHLTNATFAVPEEIGQRLHDEDDAGVVLDDPPGEGGSA